jgi:hypothetical protein
MPEISLYTDEVDRILPNVHEKNIDQPVPGIKKHMQKPNEDDYGNKMRRVRYGLGKTFEKSVLELVQRKGQENWQRETCQKLIDTDPEGILQDITKLIGINKTPEMAQSYPCAAPDSPGGKVIPKSYLGAPHGNVNKDKCHYYCGKQKAKVKLDVKLPDIPS